MRLIGTSPGKSETSRTEQTLKSCYMSWHGTPDRKLSADRAEAMLRAEKLEDGSLDPDELLGDPEWFDEGADDET